MKQKVGKKESKIIGTVKSKVGGVEIVTLLAFLTLLLISIRQFVKEDFQEDWIYLIFADITLITLLLSFINFKNKTIILTKESITINRPLVFYSKTYPVDSLLGYDLEEVYDNSIGLTKQIRIWTKDENKIVLLRDAYSDYSRIFKELKKINLRYLGTVEIKSRYKKLIGTGLQIATALTMLMFGLAAWIRNSR